MCLTFSLSKIFFLDQISGTWYPEWKFKDRILPIWMERKSHIIFVFNHFENKALCTLHLWQKMPAQWFARMLNVVRESLDLISYCSKGGLLRFHMVRICRWKLCISGAIPRYAHSLILIKRYGQVCSMSQKAAVDTDAWMTIAWIIKSFCSFW